GAALTITDSAVSDNVRLGVVVDGDGSHLDATNVLIEGTLQSPDGTEDAGTYGDGVLVFDKGSVTLQSIAIANNYEAGVVDVDANSQANIQDSIVERTLEDATPFNGEYFGRGIEANKGGQLTIERTIVNENYSSGVLATGSGSGATIHQDILIHNRASTM